MGNCCTTNGKESAENPNSKQSRIPPPSHPLLEEESVKEVLSETPTMPKRPAVFRTHNEHRKFTPYFPDFPNGKPRNDAGSKKPAMIFNSEELSEDAASEICSTHSESVSTATYFTEKNVDDDVTEIRQRSPAKLRNRSLSGDVRRDRSAGRSPAKNSDPSPNRVRSGSGRENRGLGPNLQKRECGENSGRRSRSPATRTEGGGGGLKAGMQRSGSVRRTGKSPGRVRSETGEKIRKLDETNSMSSSSNKWPPTTTSNESLENPFVSLECFIFL
ncbi:hypothetical protein M9H77_25800 [Catharanthus roseus]|uniref:Uncharacterized protein n=1 Tax=Catharanthus roseus TaxID=4058 RepID=A0ACC0A979_CATRO|nr:hypothetical protein M9H77_25800 [Catharanthus roseus]